MADRPPSSPPDPDIRFLDREELEALLHRGRLPRPTRSRALADRRHAGLRQGKLVALRWRDVDWTARVIRVRHSYCQGHWTPKSRRSSRAVAMADGVARELGWHFRRSAYTDDDDLVFRHPHTRTP